MKYANHIKTLSLDGLIAFRALAQRNYESALDKLANDEYYGEEYIWLPEAKDQADIMIACDKAIEAKKNAPIINPMHSIGRGC